MRTEGKESLREIPVGQLIQKAMDMQQQGIAVPITTNDILSANQGSMSYERAQFIEKAVNAAESVYLEEVVRKGL